MNPTPSAITEVERAAIAEEVASSLRHELRNRLASVRNAAFYIERRTRDGEAWRADPRVGVFFQLISDELDAAEKLLSGRTTEEP